MLEMNEIDNTNIVTKPAPADKKYIISVGLLYWLLLATDLFYFLL